MKKTNIVRNLISSMFIIILFLNLLLKGRIEQVTSEILGYSFWFIFGLLIGVFLTINVLRIDLKDKDINKYS